MADLQKRLEKAEKYLQKGKQDSALNEYLEILEEDPNNDSVRQTAADLCISLGRSSDGIALLSASFDRQAQGSDGAKAILTYKKLARLHAPTLDQTVRFAQLVEKKDKKEAIDAYHTAIDGLLGANRKPDVLKLLERLVTLEPSVPNLQRQGEIAAELGDGKTAAQAYYQAGGLFAASGDPHEYYEKAFGLDPANVDVALVFGRSLLAKGTADRAVTVLQAFATAPSPRTDISEAYGRALLAAGRPLDAEPYILALYERDPKQADEVAKLIGALLDSEHGDKALAAAQRLEEHETKRGKRRDYVGLMKDNVADKHPMTLDFLEYMVEMYNSTNREHDYCDTLLKLFELYFAAGNYLKAADSLDRAAEVDPYESGHHRRMDMLRGKIEPSRFNAIAGRLKIAGGVDEQQKEEQKPEEKEPTVLEDFMLQAEIFLQYSMRSKAIERLERISKLFPREEEKNEKLHMLYANAGYIPKYTDAPPPAPAPSAAPAGTTNFQSPGTMQFTPAAVINENAVDNIARVTEITRNIYRQGNVKSVLFTCVNDVGRHWNASRCVAGLCTPGKPPSAALEYCGTSVKQSEVMSLVKLINTLQMKLVSDAVVAISNTAGSNDPAGQYIASLGIASVLAVPLLDGDEQVGILLLEQCDHPREWRQTDIVVLKTIADQTQQAVQNAKLRSLMKTLAVTDEKSGLLKRSSYLDVLLSETRRALQQTSTSTVMLLHFGKPSVMIKEVGETALENLMQSIGQTICSHIRQNDVAVHYEATTIAVVLADTNEKNAFFVVDKLRKVLVGTKLPGTDKPVVMTVGIAEAVVQQKYDPIDIVTEVINRAESALEVAKAEGGGKAQSLAPQYESAVAQTA